MSRVTIETLRRATDVRGSVFEPLDALGLAAHHNVHVVLTDPLHIRGNHFHTRGSEVTTVIGPARVRYREDGELHTMEVPTNEVWRFSFPAGITHAFQNPGPAVMIIVSFNSLSHDPADPDTTRDVIL